jgi:hypothetical protein
MNDYRYSDRGAGHTVCSDIEYILTNPVYDTFCFALKHSHTVRHIKHMQIIKLVLELYEYT